MAQCAACGTILRGRSLDQRPGELGEPREPCEAADVLVGRLPLDEGGGGELPRRRCRPLAEPELAEAAGAAAAAAASAMETAGRALLGTLRQHAAPSVAGAAGPLPLRAGTLAP